jgi:hemerythrin-like domain-containing protein
MTSSIRKYKPLSPVHDAIALLRNDHELLVDLFELFEQAADRRQMKVVTRLICKLLSVHMTIEEELVYPVAHRVLSRDAAIYEAEVEHTAAKVLIADLETLRVADESFTATVRVLSDYVRRHFKAEETTMFPQLAAANLDMRVLGNKLASRRLDLLALAGIAESELISATAYKPHPTRTSRGRSRTRTVSLRTLVARLVAQRAGPH